MICISLGDIPFVDARILAHSSQMVEIRQDLAGFSHASLAELVKTAKRCIITCRPGKLSDSERFEIYKVALKSGAAYVDIGIENDVNFIAEVVSLVKEYSGDLILSYHNYEMTPHVSELESIMKYCYDLGGNVAKIATMVQHDEDIAGLLGLYRKQGRKVVLGMGEKGMITRVASIPLGAEFTFAAPNTARATAPGQLTESELLEIYRILKISEL